MNKGLSIRLNNKESIAFRKSLLKLRRYTRSKFFKDSINVFALVIRKKLTADILSEFISFQLSLHKKHNYFITFIRRSLLILIKSRYSKISGLKVRISGRFNGARRARTRLFHICKVPSQTLKANINYNQSISFTSNGTFGVKVWVSL